MLHNKGLALNYQQDVFVMKNLYEEHELERYGFSGKRQR